MAKTQPKYKPRRIRDEADRSTGAAGYISLSEEGQRFLGIALFEGNPAEDEPGYYEYMEHWVQTGAKGGSVPCAGEDCIYCEDGDKPKTRAKSLWLVLKDEKGNELTNDQDLNGGKGQLRTFNINSVLIKQFTEMRGEGDKILGRTFRVTRLDDRGNYSLMPKSDTIAKKEVKELLKAKDAPDYDSLITAQLNKAMEGVSVRQVMDDDDDDEDEDDDKKTTAKKGKGAKGKAVKDDEDDDKEDEDEKDWPEEGEDEEVTVKKVGTKADPNTIEVESEDYEGKTVLWGTADIDVTELSKGDTITVTYETDGDGDKVISEMEEAEAAESDPDKNDLPDSIEDVILEVISVNADESTIEVKNEELEFTLFFLDTMEIDFDDYEEGAKIKVDAEKDNAGDLVATTVPEVQKAKSGGKKSTAKGKGKGKGKK